MSYIFRPVSVPVAFRHICTPLDSFDMFAKIFKYAPISFASPNIVTLVRQNGFWWNLLKVALLWNAEPCSLIEILRCFRCDYCLNQHGNESKIYVRGDNWGSNHLWNVDQCIYPDYPTQHLRRQSSFLREKVRYIRDYCCFIATDTCIL